MSIDLTICMDWQAKATLAALVPEFKLHPWPGCLRVRTYQLVNGREHHAAIVAQYEVGGPAVIVSFGEGRNHDGLVVQTTRLDIAPFNAPSVNDLTEEGYRDRECFDRGDVVSAAEQVVAMVAKFVLDVSRACRPASKA